MTLSDLINEYVSASKRADKLIVGLHSGFTWRSSQDAVELAETLKGYEKAFREHGLHSVALECSLMCAEVCKARMHSVKVEACTHRSG